jgi:hypothetical protein
MATQVHLVLPGHKVQLELKALPVKTAAQVLKENEVYQANQVLKA